MVETIRHHETESGKKDRTVFIKKNKKMLGRVSYGPQTNEEKFNKNFRRSLFAVEDIRKGGKFTRENVRSIRPGYGLPPKELDKILGKTAKGDISRGTPLSWNLISK